MGNAMGAGGQKSTGVLEELIRGRRMLLFLNLTRKICMEKIGKFDGIIPTFKEDGKRSVLRLAKTGD